MNARALVALNIRRLTMKKHNNDRRSGRPIYLRRVSIAVDGFEPRRLRWCGWWQKRKRESSALLLARAAAFASF
jgi:hypothetical protein